MVAINTAPISGAPTVSQPRATITAHAATRLRAEELTVTVDTTSEIGEASAADLTLRAVNRLTGPVRVAAEPLVTAPIGVTGAA